MGRISRSAIGAGYSSLGKCCLEKGRGQEAMGFGMGLTRYSVVQRQLWLMGQNMSKAQAYDVARKEFYALRHEEEIERRVAKEEAMWVGAYFGKGPVEVGMQLEDKTYEKWKAWAEKEVAAINLLRDAAYTSGDPEADLPDDGLEDGDHEEVHQPADSADLL